MQTMHYMYSENIICLHLSDDHNSQFTMQWPISEQTNRLTRTGLIYLHCINQHLSVFYQPTLNSCNIFTIIWKEIFHAQKKFMPKFLEQKENAIRIVSKE